MATTFGPPLPLDGPPPVPYPYGIYSVARELDREERAAMGIQLLPYPPDVPRGFDPCSAGTFREKADGSEIDAPLFAGFTAYTPITCLRRGITDDEFRRKATVTLAATDQWILERELVAGTIMGHVSPYVGKAGVNTISSAGWSVARSLAMLEDAIAATGRKGVIGLTPGAVAVAGFENLRVVDGHLETANGTPVIAGQGFVGQHPAGTSAPATGKEYAWAFGPAVYWRGEAHVPGGTASAATDRVTNVTTYRAERNLVVGWDGILRASVLVDYAA